ncbi:MAG: SpoIIE family protein phosphatase [Salinivirgaceae bacterium]|nr:SpoIIE family protein phosphatase [Salinivirgaceae bacterium]
MQKKVLILILVSLLINVTTSFAQKYYFDNYSVKEGLSQSKVNDLIQDKDGFIWLGTASGISKFDGKLFVNYSADDGLSENGVRSILQDSKGNIWFGHTGGGITVFDGKSFKRISIDTIKIKSDITSFLEDSKGRFWIGTQGDGAYKLDKIPTLFDKTLEHTHYTGKSKLSDRIYFITELSNGKILFVIDVMIKYFDEEEQSFKTYKQEGLSYFFQITTIFEDSNKNIWYGTYNGGLYRQDKESGNITLFDTKRGLANNFVSCITQDIHGAIWVGTWGGGITRIDPNFIIFNQNNGLGGNKIWNIISDREGNILIGTNENGLSIFKGEQLVSFNIEHGLLSEQVSAITEDNQNNIWIGTAKGLSKYNLSGKTIKSISETTNFISKEIIALKKAPNGIIWIATKEDGVYSYNTENGKLNYSSRFNSSVMQFGTVTTGMEVDKDGHVWVGTINGLFYYQPENNAFVRIRGGVISSLYFDKKNVMWVGMQGKGVTTINDTIFETIDTLGNITPQCFTEDLNGNIWIGTEGQGVIVYSKDKKIQRFKTSNGLLADLITSLQTDLEGNIWIGTNKGLNKYDPKQQSFYAYSERSGFTGIEVKNNALFIGRNGNLWCGTVNGLFKFSPDKERINTLEPLTHITNMKVNLKDHPMTKGLRLSYIEKSIYFEFHSICLTDAEKVRYKYILVGGDNDWQPATTQTYKTYSPLPPGKYTFKVKACNNRGIWNEEPISYSFSIKPPFYLTWWFILIMVVFITAGIIVYINIREQNLKREKIILENKVKARTAEVVKKSEELAKKNKDITDSITYAKRIQQAILPSDDFIKKHVPESFVLFKPKDIVSGDFYWFEAIDNKIMFSAIDCTGHGVPGAFVSIIGHESIQRAISEFQLRNPADILTKINDLVQDSLQSGGSTNIKDGMDMALCVYDPNTKILEYSGANNPIYIIRSADKPKLVRNGEEMEPTMTGCEFNLFETKANKQPIGAYISRVPFVCHFFELIENDTIYIFSDGYADQFGGNMGRKFMYKNMKETLLNNQGFQMEQQKTFYNQIINAWMGKVEQIDDICLMGMRF